MSALGQYRTSGPAQKKAGAVSALAFVNDLLLRVGGSLQAFFELLDVLRRQLRALKLDREFVEFGRQRERWLVVGVVDAGQRIGTDVEALVPLQDRRQGLFHLPGGDDLASTFSVPVPERPTPEKLLNASVPAPRPSYLKSNSTICLPGATASGPSHLRRSRSTMFHSQTGLLFCR